MQHTNVEYAILMHCHIFAHINLPISTSADPHPD